MTTSLSCWKRWVETQVNPTKPTSWYFRSQCFAFLAIGYQLGDFVAAKDSFLRFSGLLIALSAFCFPRWELDPRWRMGVVCCIERL